jgi:hypothetical protein
MSDVQRVFNFTLQASLGQASFIYRKSVRVLGPGGGPTAMPTPTQNTHTHKIGPKTLHRLSYLLVRAATGNTALPMHRSQDSNELRAGRSGFGSRKGKILLIHTAPIPALGPSQPPIQWIPEAISPRVKRPGREAHHSPRPSAEVKNSGAIHPLPHVSSLHSA